jgi:hypothetical protein
VTAAAIRDEADHFARLAAIFLDGGKDGLARRYAARCCALLDEAERMTNNNKGAE